MYRAVIYFEDLKDGRHPYNIGDVFPREGLEVSEERIRELLGQSNLRRMAVIEKVEEESEPKKLVRKMKSVLEVKDESAGTITNAKSKPRKTKQRK